MDWGVSSRPVLSTAQQSLFYVQPASHFIIYYLLKNVIIYLGNGTSPW